MYSYVEKDINWPKLVNFDKKNYIFDVWVLSDLTNSYIDKSLEKINLLKHLKSLVFCVPTLKRIILVGLLCIVNIIN